MQGTAVSNSNIQSTKQQLFRTTAIAIPLPLMAARGAQAAPGQYETPTGFNVQAGAATSALSGAHNETLTVTQTTDRAVINWNTFNIGKNAATVFAQPGAGSVTINQVVSNN